MMHAYLQLAQLLLQLHGGCLALLKFALNFITLLSENLQLCLVLRAL